MQIIVEKLKFPSGTATAQVIDSAVPTDTVVPSPWLHTQMIATLHRSELTAEAVRTPARGPVADGAASWASKWKLLKRTLLLSAFVAALPHWFPVRVCYRPRDDRAVLTRWV